MEKQNYEEMLNSCKDFSKLRLNRNLIFVKSVLFVLNPVCLLILDILLWAGIWSMFIFLGLLTTSLMTGLIFVITHILYWKFIGSKSANALIENVDIEQTKLLFKALEETKINKFEK